MCTRTLYVGSGSLVITGRSMDWGEDMHSNAWAFPRGMARDGAAGPGSVRWTSKYGSVGNGLYLAESNYGVDNGKPPISIMVLLQYVLDCYGTVAEAVEGLSGDQLRVIAPVLPNGRPAQCHLSLSDPSGDSAIFEWIDGKPVIHHGPDYRVLTNSPTYDQQLAIRDYWAETDPLTSLPGAIRAADRFVRASFLINAIPTELDPDVITAVAGGTFDHQAVAGVLSVMRAVGVPLGVSHPSKPNLASSLWRTVYDQKNRVMYFDSATTPNAFWVPLADLDFSEGAPVKKLTIAGGTVYAGNAAANFAPSEPFAFLAAQA